MKRITIRFADHGQDFLEWDVATKNKNSTRLFVVATRPFQKAWVGREVRFDAGGPKAGGKVFFRENDVAHEIKYPIEAVRVTGKKVA